ncbi:MAG TPA: glucose-6-phosphate dehydrogenase [Anaerolineales bacterium]|nr:glucose-6-phosphate dehydrogenase [Anaerolineales bacterium]
MTTATILVIFGASGDLTRRKLIPAVFELHRKGRLPQPFYLLGAARSPSSDDAFRDASREGLLRFAPAAFDAAAWEAFAPQLHYLEGDFATAEDGRRLADRLSELSPSSNVLFYLATPPQAYTGLVDALAAVGLTDQSAGWRRVVIEKPFGSDLDTARQLNAALHRNLREDQIYRIDHYLGKETVQNVLVLRFANSIFEPIWNRNYIDHVQITVAEAVGIEHRGRFYDTVGVLRDVFQNHLLQLLAMVAMEPPSSFDAEALRDERQKVLQSVRPIDGAEAARHSLRGQYDGYLQEDGVDRASSTATFGALRLFIDNWRWQGVPFYLRSGKYLAAKTTQVSIQFKSVPHLMFPLPAGESIRPNALFICLQPDEGIHLRFEVKVPDSLRQFRSVDMEFHYAEDFGPQAIPEAYERLLLDALNGDASLYMRADGIELGWALVDPIGRAWEAGQPALQRYARGSWGPSAAVSFLGVDGRAWAMGCGDGSMRLEAAATPPEATVIRREPRHG